MQKKLRQLIDIFVDGVEEDYGEEIATLMHDSLYLWGEIQKSVDSHTKEQFRRHSILLLLKQANLREADAASFIEGFLDALAGQIPKFWEPEQ